MDLHNNPNMGTDLLEVKVRQLEDKINELTQNLGHVEQTVDGFSGEITTNELTVESLPGITPVAGDSCIGFDENGKLIPVDPAAGFERWETAPIRARTIKPKNNAEVLIDTVLTLDNVSEETMNNSMVLTLDESGNVVKVDMLEKAQKKLTAGYNISIASDGTISCDIQTMSFKGSVETYADLPATGNVTGDVWNVIAISTNYCWNGSAWIAIGSSVDLSNYYTKAEVYTKTETNSKITTDIKSAVLSMIYPVGSIKISENNVNPGTYITGTTWELKSSGRVLQGADSEHLGGTTIDAGLPNITGKVFSFISGGANVNEGALSQSASKGAAPSTGSSNQWKEILFNAADGETDTDGNLKTVDSEKVYGKSNTVQPAAYVVYIWKRTA